MSSQSRTSRPISIVTKLSAERSYSGTTDDAYSIDIYSMFFNTNSIYAKLSFAEK